VTSETANLMIALRDGVRMPCCALQSAIHAGRSRRSLNRDYHIPTFAIKGEDNDTYYSH